MNVTNPAGPTPANVADTATIPRALRLRDMTVIGIFGPETALRALIRLPGGAIREVARGSTLRNAVVAGIDAQGVMLRRGDRTERLPLPQG